MTIATETNRVVAEGNGATTQFSYNFLIPSATDVTVIVTDADGNDTTLTTSQYSITGLGENTGGLVTYPLVGDALDAGEYITIVRELPLKQLVSISNQGAFYPSVVETALDRIVMQIQQVNDLFSRALVAPVTDPDLPLPLPGFAQRANQLLGFDSDGNPIAAEPSEALVSSAMQPVVAAATLALARTAMGLGDLATMALGRGLLDVSGAATVNSETSEVSTTQDPTAADHLKTYIATANVTINLPRANTLWNGFGIYVKSGAFVVTVAINANDAFKGQSSGTSLTIQPGNSVFITCDADATGIWYVNYSNTIVPMASAFAGLVTPGGRLTLTTGVPVLSSSVTGATTIYYTPYLHNIVALYDGTSNWVPFNFSEMSQALNDSTKSPLAAAANSVYDLFVWNDSGTLRCTRGPAWSSATSRGTGAGTTELELFQGRYVNAVAVTNGPGARRGLYVGTIATNASVQCAMMFAPTAAAGGTANRLDVWNMYNRVDIASVNRDSTNSWADASAAWRAKNNNANNGIIFVRGLNEDTVHAVNTISYTDTGGTNSISAAVGVGLDVTNAIATGSLTGFAGVAAATAVSQIVGRYDGLPGIGLHTLTAIEYEVAGTVTWYGDNNAPTISQTGFTVGCQG